MADDVDLLQEHETEIEVDEGPRLPDGVQNLITRAGMNTIKAELSELLQTERPALLKALDQGANGDSISVTQRLRKVEARIAYLSRRIDGLTPVDNDARMAKTDKVYFGATVEYDDEDGKPHKVRLVGVDEVDAAKGMISWLSPIGRALMGAHVDDEVEVRAPRGSRSIIVTSISY